MRTLVILMFMVILAPHKAISYGQRATLEETKLFCTQAELFISSKFKVALDVENCFSQNIYVAADHFFHEMQGIVILKEDSNGLVDSYLCKMSYGGLPRDNDLIEKIDCTP